MGVSSGKRTIGWRTAIAVVPVAVLILGGVWLVRFVSPSASNAEASEGSGTASLETVDAVVAATRNYLSTGSWEQALMIVRRATERYPREAVLHALYAEALLGTGDAEGALAKFVHASELGPDRAGWRDFAGTIAASLQRWEESATHFGMAQRLDPSNAKYPLLRAQAQRAMGDVDAARVSLTVATRLDPGIAEGWATLADIALNENRPTIALQHIEKARRIDPESPVYRIIEARALRREGRAEEAANTLYAIPEQTRLTSAPILAELAMCLGMLGEREAVAAMYVRAAEASPADPEIAFEAAQWLERVGRVDEAAAYGRRAAYMGHENARKWCEQRGVPM